MNAGDFSFANPAALGWAWAVIALGVLVALRARLGWHRGACVP